MGFTKSKPRIITCRQNYKNFNSNAFRSEIQSLCSSEINLVFFKDSIFRISNKHAPIKITCLRVNEAPFRTKEVQVAIIKRSRLRNKFLRVKNQVNRDNYKIQRNLCKKPKTYILAILIQKKSRIIELFGKQLFLSLQTNRQKVKIFY